MQLRCIVNISTLRLLTVEELTQDGGDGPFDTGSNEWDINILIGGEVVNDSPFKICNFLKI